MENNLGGNECSLYHLSCKSTNIQERKEENVLSSLWGIQGEERKEPWGIILAWTLNHEVVGFVIMVSKLSRPRGLEPEATQGAKLANAIIILSAFQSPLIILKPWR